MRPHLFALLFCGLILPLPLFAQEEDDDEESSIEIETVPEGDDDDDRPTSKAGPTRGPARVKGQKIGTKKITTRSGKYSRTFESIDGRTYTIRTRDGKGNPLPGRVAHTLYLALIEQAKAEGHPVLTPRGAE